MTVFRLTMLQASEGDSLVLSYGDTEQRLRHVVIDGGRKATWPQLKSTLAAIKARGEDVELLVLSHIDADHIDGLLAMIEADPADLPLEPRAVWYNGRVQIARVRAPTGLEPLGFPAAEDYSTALDDRGWPVNADFGGKPLTVESQPDPIDVAGLSLTLISPTRDKLWKLRQEWDKWRKRTLGAGLQPLAKRPMPSELDVEELCPPSSEDGTAPNGSSIAFIAEYGGRRVLLGADAHPDVVAASLKRLSPHGALRVVLAKLPHHGSRANVTRAVIEALDCSRFAISTSGAVFGHPDPEAIARLLKFGTAGAKTLYFNYASDRTLPWDDDNVTLKQDWDYTCVFPAEAGAPLVIDI